MLTSFRDRDNIWLTSRDQIFTSYYSRNFIVVNRITVLMKSTIIVRFQNSRMYEECIRC